MINWMAKTRETNKRHTITEPANKKGQHVLADLFVSTA